MKLYIDKSNVHSLLASPKNEKFDSVIRLIRNQLNVGFNFEKSEGASDEVLQKFLTQSTLR